MSNRQKIRQPQSAPRERCTFCQRSLGPGSSRRALHLRNGQVACAKCQQNGYMKKLACGHFGIPGALAVNENGDGKTFVCAECASSAEAFGNARFGLGRKA